jgi:hypothetical protein
MILLAFAGIVNSEDIFEFQAKFAVGSMQGILHTNGTWLSAVKNGVVLVVDMADNANFHVEGINTRLKQHVQLLIEAERAALMFRIQPIPFIL